MHESIVHKYGIYIKVTIFKNVVCESSRYQSWKPEINMLYGVSVNNPPSPWIMSPWALLTGE